MHSVSRTPTPSARASSTLRVWCSENQGAHVKRGLVCFSFSTPQRWHRQEHRPDLLQGGHPPVLALRTNPQLSIELGARFN